MIINGNNYSTNNKKVFKKDGEFETIIINKVFDFAYEMAFGEGEHRGHRSGGQSKRRNSEIFINAFQGKLAELGIYNFISLHNKEMYENLSKPDFDIYGLGQWDNADIEINDIKFSIKSTKNYGNLLLLETKDWDKNAQYIPNIETGNSNYDFTVLVRVSPDGESILKKEKLLYSDNIDKALLKDLICNNNWEYDIPGYLTTADLKEIIRTEQIIPQNAMLNTYTKMDAENYYEETGKLRDFSQLVKNYRN